MAIGLQAPADWGYTGYDSYSPPAVDTGNWGDLGSGLSFDSSGLGFDYGNLPIDPSSYLSPYTSSYIPSITEAPGFWDQLTSGNLTGALGSAYTNLGGLKGLANLGLGGLSAYYTLKAKDEDRDLAERRLEAELGLRQTEQNQDLAKTDAMMNLLSQRGRVSLDPRRYAEIVASGQIPADMLAAQQRVDVGAPAKLARGGLGLLRGGTSGQADEINARLSDGEYVMDADVVAALGDGNTEAGARRLDEMRERVRRHKRSAGAKSIPPPAKSPLEYLKKGR